MFTTFQIPTQNNPIPILSQPRVISQFIAITVFIPRFLSLGISSAASPNKRQSNWNARARIHSISPVFVGRRSPRRPKVFLSRDMLTWSPFLTGKHVSFVSAIVWPFAAEFELVDFFGMRLSECNRPSNVGKIQYTQCKNVGNFGVNEC
jgi:hypothetical protein